MAKKIFGLALGIPVAALGLVTSAGNANAASLNAPGEISFTSSVVLTGELDGGGSLIGTQFDFVDPLGPTNGEVDIAALSGSGGFTSFNGVTLGSPDGLLTDNTILAGGIVSSPGTPFDLLQLFDDNTGDGTPDNDTFFMLTNVDSEPTFSQIGNDLEVSVGVEGMWRSPDGEFDGSLIFTTQFVDTTQAELIAQLETGNPILPANGVSVTGEATPKDIPEPTSTGAALLVMSLSAVSLKKKQK